MERLKNWLNIWKKKKSTLEKNPKYYTYDTFIPNPGMGMWSFDDLESYMEAIGENDALMISKDRLTIITWTDSMYYVYYGDELKEGIKVVSKDC